MIPNEAKRGFYPGSIDLLCGLLKNFATVSPASSPAPKILLTFTKKDGSQKSMYHSGFVPARQRSGGTYSLADTFPQNISAIVGVPPEMFRAA